MTGGKCDNILSLSDFSTLPDLREVWNKVKNDKGFMTGGKMRQYPYFARLLHTSTPLRSVELSKKWRNSGFHGQGWTWLAVKAFHYKLLLSAQKTNAGL